jgi:hypothetical protein
MCNALIASSPLFFSLAADSWWLNNGQFDGRPLFLFEDSRFIFEHAKVNDSRSWIFNLNFFQ